MIPSGDWDRRISAGEAGRVEMSVKCDSAPVLGTRVFLETVITILPVCPILAPELEPGLGVDPCPRVV